MYIYFFVNLEFFMYYLSVDFDMSSSRENHLVTVSLNLANKILQTPGAEVIKLFSCSTQMSMKFFPAY